MFSFHVEPGQAWLCTGANCLAPENLLESEREEAYKAGMYLDNNCHGLG